MQLEPSRRPARLRAAWTGLIAASLVPLSLVSSASASAPREVIVLAAPGRVADAERLVARAGGEIGVSLPIVNGFAASLDAADIASLENDPAIAAIADDRKVRLSSHEDDDDPSEDGTLARIAKIVRATDLWKHGITGDGVDVALIDSGIAPVDGLTAPGKILNGPDLSFDSVEENLRHLDLYGHGTHMAGIIAGRDGDDFTGIAPGARLVNVKVANALGATDVSQVIAAIDWVVQHRHDAGLNVRVLNLSFGTDSTQDTRIDPLAFATEVAWRSGIVVVTSAGNRGAAGLTSPARDPFVLAVGADDTAGTRGVGDDAIPSWSSRGGVARNPDLVAPGRSLMSLRVPGSYLDATYPGGRSGERFFRGSGTSQAAAVVSGAAALLLDHRPGLTPDQVKALLTSGARPVPSAGADAQGAGLIDLKNAARSLAPIATQSFAQGDGTGSLEAARGSLHVVDRDGNELRGEIDIFGNAWDGTSWSIAAQAGTSWSGGTWNGTSWSGSCWCGTSWSGTSWSSAAWIGTSWSGSSWYGTSWSDASWTGTSWSSVEWPSAAGTSWSGTSWSGSSWYGTSWSSVEWPSAAGTSWSTRGWE